MRTAPKKTKILVSLFHTPTEASREIFYCVLRAGHLIAGQDYRKVHPNYPGHKILLCLRGKGHILLFAFNPMWRMNTQGTFALVMNAVLNWNRLSFRAP